MRTQPAPMLNAVGWMCWRVRTPTKHAGMPTNCHKMRLAVRLRVGITATGRPAPSAGGAVQDLLRQAQTAAWTRTCKDVYSRGVQAESIWGKEDKDSAYQQHWGPDQHDAALLECTTSVLRAGGVLMQRAPLPHKHFHAASSELRRSGHPDTISANRMPTLQAGGFARPLRCNVRMAGKWSLYCHLLRGCGWQ